MRADTARKVTALMVAAGTLTGCSTPGVSTSGQAAPITTTAPAPPSASRSVAPDVSPSVAQSGAVNDDTGEIVGAHPVPVWNDAAGKAATRAATTAMTAFARPHLGYDSWWAALEPLMTYQAAVDYAGTDPANVPASKVTGPAVVTDATSVYLALVAVPTDVGRYTVLLVRTDGDSPWLVQRLEPPEGKD